MLLEKGDLQMNNLKNLRKSRNIKVSEIIERLDISQPYYYDLESGKKRLNDELLIKFSDLYGVTTDYILGRTEHENHVILEGESLPPELKGIVDRIGIAKDIGLTTKDIEEIIDLHMKMKKRR